MGDLALGAVAREDLGQLTADLRRWLGSGALQSRSGAFCAWRDAATGELAFEYPEITGYALTWLAGFAEPSDQELDSGFCAADWIIERLCAGDRSARAGWDGGAAYSFDLGMIAAGLQSFGEFVDNARYVDVGRATARELATYIRSGRGLEAVLPDGPGTQRPGPWSTSGRVHLLKCVQSLLLADQLVAAERLVEETIALQGADGRFDTQPDRSFVMLHPHLYTVEGLWMFGAAVGSGEAIERARAATAWLWQHQLESGGLPRYVAGDECGPEQFDVTSQAIRAAVLLELEPPGLDRAVARLAEVAIATDQGRALVYQPGAAHLNAWVTMFGGQALMLSAGDADGFEWAALV